MGAPLEFLSVYDRKNDDRPRWDLKTLTYSGEKNRFGLKFGQWTDDASMGLCMADSLLEKKKFDGSDIRIKFWYQILFHFKTEQSTFSKRFSDD